MLGRDNAGASKIRTGCGVDVKFNVESEKQGFVVRIAAGHVCRPQTPSPRSLTAKPAKAEPLTTAAEPLTPANKPGALEDYLR